MEMELNFCGTFTVALLPRDIDAGNERTVDANSVRRR